MTIEERLGQLEEVVAQVIEVIEEIVNRSERPGMQELLSDVLRRAGGKRE